MHLVTIYDHPLDYPDSFVCRVFDLVGPTEQFMEFDDINDARIWAAEKLWQLNGTDPFVFPREDDDDPFILETWI